MARWSWLKWFASLISDVEPTHTHRPSHPPSWQPVLHVPSQVDVHHDPPRTRPSITIYRVYPHPRHSDTERTLSRVEQRIQRLRNKEEGLRRSKAVVPLSGTRRSADHCLLDHPSRENHRYGSRSQEESRLSITLHNNNNNNNNNGGNENENEKDYNTITKLDSGKGMKDETPEIFKKGQYIAIEEDTGRILSTSDQILRWDTY